MASLKTVGSMVLIACAAGALAASLGLAQPGKEPAKPGKEKEAAGKPSAMPEMMLPPGWTAEDMQACMVAAMPGKMHERLTKSAGEWNGKTTSWMAPGAPPIISECTSKVTMMMDGRFAKCEYSGEMPGMGAFTGLGINGFDNVSQKFQSTWLDNMGTGMMQGTGELSADGKTITWTYSFNCPLNKKPMTMRQTDTMTGPDTLVLEMTGPDFKTGKEYKMMTIELTRKK